MAEPQPPASLLVPAIQRQVQAEGGFATVLAKGSAFGSALLIVTRDGHEVEAATIGREGAVGGIVSAGSKPAFGRGVVMIGGSALAVTTLHAILENLPAA